MVVKLLRPFTYLLAIGALLLIALAGPASSEGYGDPAIAPDIDGATEAEPGGEFTVSFSSNVECAWSSTFNGQAGPNTVGFDYDATFTAPTEPGTYTGTVVCRFSTEGPFRPMSYSADATSAAVRDQQTSQTFTVVVGGDATGDDSSAGDDATGALSDTGGESWPWLALGAVLVVTGGGVAVAARRRKSA